MNWRDEARRMINEIKSSAKTAPFPVFKKAYEGMLKQVVEEPEKICFADTLIMRQLIGFWSSRIKEMKNNPEPTVDLQALQEKDCSRLLDINYRMLMNVVEPIRQRKKNEIDSQPIKDMIILLDEWIVRYRQ